MNDLSNKIRRNIISVLTAINLISKIIIILLFLILNLNDIILSKKFYNDTKYKRAFNEMLPKINFENKTIPSLEDIFNSRILYISDTKITREYIKYIRPINEIEEEKYNKRYSENETKISPNYFKKRIDQYNYVDFAKLCLEEKLLDSDNIEYNNKPLISIIFPSYNKETILLKSIRSVQNQKFKNIEMIIVNDASTDNSSKIFKYLLETDPRIRIFNHLKNMGCWRSRLDGLLYSRGKYLMLFDTGDFFEDNYVLNDAYDIIEKYKLDSVKFLFRIIRSYKNLENSNVAIHVNKESKIIYNSSNIVKFNNKIFQGWGNIWTRITRANIHFKGIYLLNDYVLNLYKNLWDDVWFNTYIHKVSFSFIICERIVYIYLGNRKGFGTPKLESIVDRDKYIQEQLGFLYFNHNMLPKNNNKKSIINELRRYNNSENQINFSFLKSNFYILENLVKILIRDPFVSNEDKEFLKLLLKNQKRKKYISIK